MVKNERVLLALGLLPFCAGLTVLLLAFTLGVPLLVPHETADTTKAQLIAIPAAVALVAGIVTLARRDRSWAPATGYVAAAAAIVAVVLTAVIPGS